MAATDPSATLAGPVLGPEGEACTQCGTRLGVDQRYCLSCGHRRADMRLAFLDIAAADGAFRPVAAAAPGVLAPPGPRSALVPLAALIALLLALGIGVLIGRGTGESSQTAVQPSVITVGAAGAAAATPATAVVSDWPAGTQGFTIALRTLPSTATAVEVAQAKQDATSAGAPSVGALKSDDYPSLTPGEIVVYSGTFPDRAKAQAGLKPLRASFAGAKVVQVSSTAGGGARAGAATPPAATAAPKNDGASKLSPKEFQKRSKTIPDEVQSQGAPPATDNAAPGAGGGATEIG